MKKLIPALLFLAIIATFSSCQKDSQVDPPQYSFVMAANVAASTSGNTVNVNIGTEGIGSIPFAGYSVYKQIPAGDKAISVDTSGTITNSNFTFEDGKMYSLYVVDDPSGLKAVPVEDILPGVTTGSTNIRFLDFSADAPAIDVAIGGNVVFRNRSYNDQANDSSLSAFATILPGTYDIEFRDPANGTVLYTFTGITIDEKKSISIIAKGSINGTNDQGFGITLVANN